LRASGKRCAKKPLRAQVVNGWALHRFALALFLVSSTVPLMRLGDLDANGRKTYFERALGYSRMWMQQDAWNLGAKARSPGSKAGLAGHEFTLLIQRRDF
jgi:hypothetical protein